jgi:hypothetical protein
MLRSEIGRERERRGKVGDQLTIANDGAAAAGWSCHAGSIRE